MTRTTNRYFAVALLWALVGAALPAQSQSVDSPPPLDQRDGVAISDASVDLPLGYIAIEILSQQNCLFEGLIGLVPPNPIVPPNPVYPTDSIRLLLSASGQVSLTSHTEEWTLNAQGALDGSSHLLDYHISYRDGTQDFGVMLLSRPGQ
jgi:hypothetical protein